MRSEYADYFKRDFFEMLAVINLINSQEKPFVIETFCSEWDKNYKDVPFFKSDIERGIKDKLDVYLRKRNVFKYNIRDIDLIYDTDLLTLNAYLDIMVFILENDYKTADSYDFIKNAKSKLKFKSKIYDFNYSYQSFQKMLIEYKVSNLFKRVNGYNLIKKELMKFKDLIYDFSKTLLDEFELRNLIEQEENDKLKKVEPQIKDKVLADENLEKTDLAYTEAINKEVDKAKDLDKKVDEVKEVDKAEEKEKQIINQDNQEQVKTSDENDDKSSLDKQAEEKIQEIKDEEVKPSEEVEFNKENSEVAVATVYNNEDDLKAIFNEFYSQVKTMLPKETKVKAEFNNLENLKGEYQLVVQEKIKLQERVAQLEQEMKDMNDRYIELQNTIKGRESESSFKSVKDIYKILNDKDDLFLDKIYKAKHNGFKLTLDDIERMTNNMISNLESFGIRVNPMGKRVGDELTLKEEDIVSYRMDSNVVDKISSNKKAEVKVKYPSWIYIDKEYKNQIRKLDSEMVE